MIWENNNLKNKIWGILSCIGEFQPGNKTIYVVFDEESEFSGPRTPKLSLDQVFLGKTSPIKIYVLISCFYCSISFFINRFIGLYIALIGSVVRLQHVKPPMTPARSVRTLMARSLSTREGDRDEEPGSMALQRFSVFCLSYARPLIVVIFFLFFLKQSGGKN